MSDTRNRGPARREEYVDEVIDAMVRLSVLERAILAWIGHREPHLAKALKDLRLRRRRRTGSGFSASFAAPPGPREAIGGPCIESAALPYGAGSRLWVVEDRPALLEVYRFGEDPPAGAQAFPPALDDFSLGG